MWPNVRKERKLFGGLKGKDSHAGDEYPPECPGATC